METLVIGIDGGDKRIIESLELPNLHKLLNDLKGFKVTSDLWSRGWAEILNGQPGMESGAFYEKPKLDGTYGFTQSFGSKEHENINNVKPLWKLINDCGKSCGFMNVPSTNPAPEVNGFFVSGAGGGLLSGSDEVPKGACYPESVSMELAQIKYIFDTRFKQSGIRNKEVFFNRLTKMIERRTEAFIHLNKKYDVDFGFIAYMGTCRINYLAMSEIEELIKNHGIPQNDFQQRIVKLYKDFDKSLGILINNIKADKVMIVSDHSQSPYLHRVNVNSFLQEIGLQHKKKIDSVNKSLFTQIKKAIPADFKNKIKRGMNIPTKSSIIDYSKDYAFGSNYVSGIYINDNERFGGPVHGQEEIDRMVNDIVEKFNNNNNAKKHMLVARPYRREHRTARYNKTLPDIWIDHPDSVFFVGRGKFVEANENYGPIKSLKDIKGDMNTGIKGRYPLLYVDKKITEEFKDIKETDLTLAYKFIEKIIK
ncbi:hypothetical protein [Alteribacillus sp. YIM 98480]|uniref:hypothetical protein n=1 Tax=Alteribacillus sp. YIM 98480 TaxID=2606599 RepID=UPI00131AFBCB|nr:hypothetical protein [Alteribacillus sp. YIM 98480]